MCYTEQRVLLKQRGDVQEEELKVGRKPNLENWGTEPTDKEGFAYRIKRGNHSTKYIHASRNY
jgi:hypothetical protein